MSELDIGDLDKVHGTPLGFDANTGEQLYANIFPKEMVLLNMEIGIRHPKLVSLLDEGLRNDAYDMSTYFGIIFSYCGIALDGNYSTGELCEQANRALINKRDNIAASINTIPSSQGLVQHLIDMKEDSKKIQIIGDTK